MFVELAVAVAVSVLVAEDVSVSVAVLVVEDVSVSVLVLVADAVSVVAELSETFTNLNRASSRASPLSMEILEQETVNNSKIIENNLDIITYLKAECIAKTRRLPFIPSVLQKHS